MYSMKAKYSQDVTVEEVKFSDEEKKRLKAGEVAFGSSARIDGSGDDATFSAHHSINTEVINVPEGSYIVTFPDGRKKVLSAEEAKESLVISKSKKDEPSESEANKVVLNTTSGENVTLDAEKSAELIEADQAKEGEPSKRRRN